MITTKLIDKAEVRKYKQISNSSNDVKFDQTVIESQLEDIKPILGEQLFYAILKDVEAAGNVYDELLDGGEYIIDGNTYNHAGLRAVICYYVYGRLVMFGDVIDNPFGMTKKLNPNVSEPLDYVTKKSFFNANQQFAYNLWLDVKHFLCRTEEPLYNVYKTNQPKKFKIGKIGG